MQRRTVIASAAALALLSFAGTGFAAPASVGQPAPGFTAPDTTGQMRSLADYKGQWVVLEWMNPGCPFVRKHYNSANMPGLQKEFAARKVVWIAVNSTEEASVDYLAPDKLAQWMKSLGAAASVTLMDPSGQIGHAYGARTTPHMYIVDPRGVLVYAGGIDSIASARIDDIKAATNYVRQGLDESLAGKPISQAVTRPYGCSIKYKS